jgi:hypothetical protein
MAAMIKDSRQIRRDQNPLDQASARHGVLHVIPNECATVIIDERVLMHPQAVGSLGLTVDKAVRRLPGRYFALPAQRDAAEFQTIVEQCSRADFGFGRENFELQPVRCNTLKVFGIGEEAKDLVRWTGQPNFGVKMMGFHKKRMHLQSLSDVIA